MDGTTTKHWWDDYSWRLIQTNFREIDMEDIDADTYVESLKEFGATVAMINVGGALASYETNVEDHVKSSFLHGSTLQAIIEAVHAAGMKVIARMDFSKAKEEVHERHPDWAYRTFDGKIVNYNGYIHMCLCGGFQQQKAFEILKEVVETLDVDGIFLNMVGFKTADYSYNYYGICHCENCKKRFHDEFGLELPDKEDMNDPVYRKYKCFQERTVSETNKRLNAMVKSLNPEIALGGVDFQRMESNTEYKVRKGPQWVYNSSSNARGSSTIPGSPKVSNAAVDFIGAFYRHNAIGEAMQSLRFNQDIANYAGLDYYLMGRLDNHLDRSSYPIVRKAFAYMKRHEKLYQHMRSKGDVLIIRNGGHNLLTDESRGWIRVLTESHILFGEVAPEIIQDDTDLTCFKAIILSDLRKIPDRLASKIDSFVHDGGVLIASGATGIYDEHYTHREKLPFKALGSASIKGIDTNQVSAILRIKESEKPLFPSLDGTEVIYFGETFVFTGDYPATAEGHLNMIPPHAYGPPEVCYFTTVSDEPGYIVNNYGEGKAVYIPWLSGTRFHQDGYLNLFFFMKDILEQTCGISSVEDKPFTPMVEVTLGESHDKSRMMVHLVNSTGFFGRSFYNPVPVMDISLRIPIGRKPVQIVDVETETSVEFSYAYGIVKLTVQRLDELKALDLRF